MGDAPDPYSGDAVARQRTAPGFRVAVEASARGVLTLYLNVDEDLRWVFRDRGRFFIGTALVMLHHQGVLTASSLRKAVSDVLREASAGRVRAFLERMLARRQLDMARDGHARPTRTIVPSPRFLDGFRQHRLGVAAALATLDPAMTAMRDAINSEEYPAVEAALTLATLRRLDIFAETQVDPVFYFFSREAGFTILFDLMLSQAPARSRLLERASVSAHGLANRHGVSRAHVLRLLTDAEAQGWVRFDRETRELTFTDAFSERMERHSAMHFLLYREAWRQYRAG